MKPVRPLLFALGLAVVAGATGLALALTPSVQRWAVLRAAASRPGFKVELAGISAGFTSFTLREVRVEKNGLSLTLGRLEADYSLWPLLFSHQLQIRRLVASGLLVDVSRLSRARAGAAAAGGSAAAPGLLAQIELPAELVLDDCQVEGQLLLPGATGKPPVPAGFKITGGRFAPGQEGVLLVTATVRNPAPAARVAVLNAQVSLRATQTTRRSFSRISLTAVVDAAGKNISEQNQLKISTEMMKDSAAENYTVNVDTLIRGATENVLAAHATLPAGQPGYAGDWRLKARTAQLEPFFLGGALPDFNASGEGRFTFDPATSDTHLQGSLQGEVSRWEAIEPAWRAIGAVSVQAQFDLTGTGGVARLHQLDVRIAGQQPVLELQAAGAAAFNLKDGRLQAGGSAPGEALDLQLHGVPLAWVRPFVHVADISGGMITGRFAVTGEPNRLLLRAVQPLRIDQLTVVQRGVLLLAKADVTLNAEVVLTNTELQANISELALQTAPGDRLAAQGRVILPRAPGAPMTVSASGTADLPKLLETWVPLGRLKAAGDIDLTLAGGKIELRRLNASVTDPAGQTLFKAAALRPFSLDSATRRVSLLPSPEPGAGAAELLRLNIGRVPLGVLPLARSGTRLDGRVEQGEFVLTADGEKLILSAATPLKLAEVSLTQDGHPALTGLAIEARPVLELAGTASTKFQTGDVTVRTANGAALVTMKGEATQLADTGRRGALTFNLEIPALASQPLFAGTLAVAAGRASGEIRVALGTPAGPGVGGSRTNQVEARLTLNGLVAADHARPLPVANLGFRAVVREDGGLSVQAPLLLDRAGQRSDLNFALELSPVGQIFDLTGKLTGERVDLEDALSVLGVFLASAAPADRTAAPSGPPVEVAADRVPAWSRFGGQLSVDVKSANYGANWAMTGLNGQVAIEPARVSLQKLEAGFGEKGRLAAHGEIKFGGGPRPYQVEGEYSLTEFDAGGLFKAIDPAKPATVEGVFTVAGHVAGDGETLDRTLERARGRFDLTSRQGIFRGLQRASSRVSMTSKAVELGAAVLGSLFGSHNVTKVAEKVAGQAYFVDQLAQSVGELNYDQLSVRLVRNESLDLTLEDFSLVSPEIRLLGKGGITYAAEKPLLEQPLSISLSVSGRGKIEQLLDKLKLLDGTRDELGYARSKEPVSVVGSLAKPDPSAFFTKVAAAKLTEMLGPEN